MASQDKEAQKRLVAIFRVEANERLSVLSSGLIELEHADTPAERAGLLDNLVREAHSLKGAARAVNLLPLEALGRSLEKVLTALRREELTSSPPLFDALHGALDAAVRLLISPDLEQAQYDASIDEHTRALEQLFGPAEAAAEGVPPPTPAPPAAVEPPPAAPRESPAPPGTPSPPPVEPLAPAETPTLLETVRIPASKLGTLMREVEQLVATRLSWEHSIAEIKAINRSISDWKRELAKYPAALKSRSAAALLSELADRERQRIVAMETRLRAIEKGDEHHLHAFGTSLANLLDDVKSVLMLPAGTLLELFPRMVRDLSRAQAKEVELTMTGGDIAIDKRILDEMKDPLIHLVRNSIDHGIEPPRVRAAKGKPPAGQVTVGITAKGGDRVEIVVGDDGAGLDAERIRAAVIRHGLLNPPEAQKLSRHELLTLALRPGVTTSPIVTDLSGRGLGLAIVQEKVLKLNGSMTFDSEVDAGSTFRIVLPLTLATFRGVLLRSAGRPFIAPTAHVEQVLRSAETGIGTVQNRGTLAIAGELLSLVKLAEVLELSEPPDTQPANALPVVVIGVGMRRIAFQVDTIQGEQEVLVKPLGRQLKRVRNISGAALLGSGEVVPVLNVHDLLAAAVKWAAGGAPRPAPEAPAARPNSLLVVEDSITTRTLLRNILEGAGYLVTTAVDGLDAFTRLREEPFDLVVSDVAMPRMDGFELTARIRSDPRLAELPVVLVTALGTREDRERGIEVGANAYIVKSRFDQSNLLETIDRLI